MAKAGEYDLRITILPRVLAAQGDNGEEPESWPASGGKDYFAARDSLSAGEVITQGIRQSTGAMKLRVRGRAISVAAYDRLKVKHTGEAFAVTGVWRERDDTVILCERVHQQSVGQ